MKKIIPLLLLFLLINNVLISKNEENTEGKVTVKGYIYDSSNGEALIGATVYIKEIKRGTSANLYGFYSISLIPGTYTIQYSFIGFNTVEMVLKLEQNQTIDISLNPESAMLQEVVVSSEKPNANVSKPEMSVAKLEMKTIQRIPALLGEVDVIKAIQLLPGVQPTAEGSSGFSVRGGAADHNLIQLDEATVYNASHMMGFFSVFNNDAIKDVKLYKGDIPASSGGRLASLLDVRMKDGNSKKFEGTGGIGSISSRFTVEGPIVKDQTSFILSGRRTYADLFLPLAKDPEVRDFKLYFYDLNTKINSKIDESNRIFISGYFGRDVFFNDFFKMGFGNQTGTIRWNHVFGSKLFLNATTVYSSYNYYLGSTTGDASSFIWKSNMTDYAMKLDFNYYLNTNNSLQFGYQSTYHLFDPGNARGVSEQSMMNEWKVPRNYALEHGLYAMNEQKIGNNLIIKYGLRLSVFQNVGKSKVYKYNSEYKVVDSASYQSGEFFNTYQNLEPRFGITYTINEKNSIKASYSHTTQYIQQASNSQAGAPLDIWFSASPNVKPQQSDQWAMGFFRNFMNNTVESSAEVYYKTLKQVVDFKDFAALLLNDKLEGELRIGEGKSYGLELLTKINREKFGGWVSYTYSRTYRTIPAINKGKQYVAPYDKPHNISIVLNYDISKRITLSANWVYATGQPYTAPVGRAKVGNIIIPIYSERNAKRYPDYHRLDMALSIKPKKNHSRRWQGEWNISVYNVYSRHNTWAINFVEDKMNQDITYAEQTYLFSIIPSITYNFKF